MRYKICDYDEQKLGEEMLLIQLSPDGIACMDRVCHLNAEAVKVWLRVKMRKVFDITDLANEMSAEYDAEFTQIYQDLHEVFGSLANAGIVQRCDDGE